jgi:hypothetical protein
MGYILYGGIKYTQARHAIYCKKCEETVESLGPYDLKYCTCGSVGVDGGIEEGNRIIGNITCMENRSMYYAEITEKKYKLWLPQEVIEQYFATMGY